MDDPFPSGGDSGAVEFLDVTAVLPTLSGGGWKAACRRMLELGLGLVRTRELFLNASRDENPAEALLKNLRLTPDAAGVMAAIPANGPVIVIANHPFGGADALALIALCLRCRTDFRILANEVIASAPGIARWVLPLAILGETNAARKNAVTLRAARAHLQNGGLLAAFPAGEVSTWQPKLGRIADIEWSPHIASLAIKTNASVLPVRFFGANPPWFHLAGAIHPLVRTALIPRVLLSHRGKTPVCRAGPLMNARELSDSGDPTAILRRTLDRVECLDH